MDDIVIVFFWYVCAFFLHVGLYRILFRFTHLLFPLCGLYFLGIPFVIAKHIVFPSPGVHLLLTSISISFLLGSITILFYFPQFLKGQTPAAMMIAAFDIKPSWKKRELFNLFSEKELIDTRLDMLVTHKYIQKKQHVYTLTTKGKVYIILLSLFLYISGMEVGG